MTTNMNPMQLLQMMRQGGNPQQFVYNMIQERVGGNPLFANLLTLAKEGRGDEIENIARNIMKEQGKDFDTEFNSFKRAMGL